MLALGSSLIEFPGLNKAFTRLNFHFWRRVRIMKTKIYDKIIYRSIERMLRIQNATVQSTSIQTQADLLSLGF